MAEPTKVDEGLYHVFEVVKAACALVKSPGIVNRVEVDLGAWNALVNAVTNYRGLIDPDAAKRNRDEHGPDIPTEGLDWRSKL